MSINVSCRTDPVLEQLRTDALSLDYRLIPWDSDIFGMPVAQIEHIAVADAEAAKREFRVFDEWRQRHHVALVSCRLPHDRLVESFLLESRGFLFVEMVYPMGLDGVATALFPVDAELAIECAVESDLAELKEIAASAFATGRFNLDPRIGPQRGGARYSKWVENSIDSDSQRVAKASIDNRIVGFFVYEHKSEGIVYWHLTAVSPKYQGCGIGERLWRAMIMIHRGEGRRRIETTISARNTPVMNLYAKLGFRFGPPQMTFHWVGE